MSIGIRVAKLRLLDTRQSFRLGAEHRLEPDEWPELATHRFCLPQTEPVDHLIASAPYVRNPRIDAPREKCLGSSTARGNLRLPHNSIRSPSSATSTPLNARAALGDPADRCVSTTRGALQPGLRRAMSSTLKCQTCAGFSSKRNRGFIHRGGQRTPSKLLPAPGIQRRPAEPSVPGQS